MRCEFLTGEQAHDFTFPLSICPFFLSACSSIETAVVIDSSQDGCGFDLKRSGGSWTSSHRGVKFGTSIAPAPRKNQDRCSQQRIDLSGFPNAGGSLMYGFGLFDGHGKSSAIAELAAEKLLKSLSKVVWMEIV